MTPNITIARATARDSHEVAEMAGELLREIMDAIGVQAFNFDLEETTDRLMNFLNRKKYFVFVARDEQHSAVGFIAIVESHALYAAPSEPYPSYTCVPDSAQGMWGSISWPRQSLLASRVAGRGWR